MEKLWLKGYGQDINAEIDTTQYSSISDAFRQSVEKFSDKPTFQNTSETLIYAEMGKLAADFVSYLQNVLKLPRGERVAIMMSNVLQYPVALFGILQAGLVTVSTSPPYTPRRSGYRLRNSDAITIVVSKNFTNTLELVLPHTQIRYMIVASAGEMFGMVRDALMNFVTRKMKKIVLKYRIPNTVTLQAALKQGTANMFRLIGSTCDDIVLLQCTGGTTGLMKGAVLSHDNIHASMLRAKEWVGNSLREGEETVIAVLPFYHIFVLAVDLMISTNAGSRIVLITNPRGMKGLIGELKEESISVFIGANILFNVMVNRPGSAEVNFSRLKLALDGSMAT